MRVPARLPVLCCAVLCCAVLCRAMPCRAVPCRAVPCCAVPCRAVPCCAVPCRAVLCRAMPCCAVLLMTVELVLVCATCSLGRGVLEKVIRASLPLSSSPISHTHTHTHTCLYCSTALWPKPPWTCCWCLCPTRSCPPTKTALPLRD